MQHEPVCLQGLLYLHMLFWFLWFPFGRLVQLGIDPEGLLSATQQRGEMEPAQYMTCSQTSISGVCVGWKPSLAHLRLLWA